MTPEPVRAPVRDAYYVTAALDDIGTRPGLLLGPFPTPQIAAQLVEPARRHAQAIATFGAFYTCSVGRYRLSSNQVAPAGSFNADLLSAPALGLLAADLMPTDQRPRTWNLPGHGELTTAPVRAGQLRLRDRVILDAPPGPAVHEVTSVYSSAAATPLILREAGSGRQRTIADPRGLLHRVAEHRPANAPRIRPTAAQIAGQAHPTGARTAAGARTAGPSRIATTPVPEHRRGPRR